MDVTSLAARVVLLGTAGGSLTWTPAAAPGSTTRFGISTAVVVGDAIYLVDAGAGSTRQLTLADPLERGSADVMSNLRGVFITHLHSDHVMDLANYMLCSYNQGWPAEAVHIYGPWARNLADSRYSFEKKSSYSVTDDVPGTEHLVSMLAASFAADTADRVLGAGKREFRHLVTAHDIRPPTSPSERIIPVYGDGRVKVSATLVEHGAMEPALAYRFDTETGSVVLSGDTGPCDNLVELAQGADLLIHEAISPSFARASFGEPPYTVEQRAAMDHVFSKHTSAAQIGKIATRCGVQRVALSHLVPGNATESDWRVGEADFDGEFIVGQDLMTIPFG